MSVLTDTCSIRSVTIPCDEKLPDSPLLVRDRQVAMRDLETHSKFKPVSDAKAIGPYDVSIRIQDSRLVLEITACDGVSLPIFVLSLKPYKRLIRDYFLIVRSYDEAMKEGKPSRIEAIDMGRRGLHNEGAELLQGRLSDKIIMDFDTARRLFTLICVLHGGKAIMWRS